ncbi:AAA family ATPase [Nocardioides sp. NPDC057764]|uniref:AAA family ATPase n=1 Tax=Nocardioides sp. NPDC057764 TaxID=3346243 RepID=UPI00366A6004
MHSVNGAWVHGFAIKGVGSLRGDELARVGPLGKINFLVGRNNHGKSTLLRLARHWACDPGSHLGTPPAISPESEALAAQTLVPVQRQSLHSRARQLNKTEADLIAEHGWIEIDADHIGIWVDRAKNQEPKGLASTALKRTIGSPGSGAGVRAAFADDYVLIPAFRQLRPGPQDALEAQSPTVTRHPVDLASGEGLIAELSRWQHPMNPGSEDYETARGRWRTLRAFLRDVLEDPDADIEVAGYTDLHVQLAQAGRMLKIDALGDGIKQILMIATACVYYDGRLVCLEEPEIHLHAGLQRKLLKFLAEKTRSQYLIATHSAHVLDMPDARIFHVTHDGEKTSVSPAVRASEVQRVCQDLGYMASDLLQANYVIWVEGPSDRIYWRRWLELVDPELEEGVHYTIMIYGGYLLDALRTDPEDIPEVSDIGDDLIQILKLGRACTVITDSDKASASAPLRPVVQRILKEAEIPGSGTLVVCDWVRTVENLLPRDLLRDTVIGLHPVAGKRLRTAGRHGPFDQPFVGMPQGTYSKVRISQAIAPKLSKADIGEKLLEQVESLAARVREANGLSPVDD